MTPSELFRKFIRFGVAILPLLLSLSFLSGRKTRSHSIFVRFFICPWTPQTPIHRLAPPFWGVKPYCEAATEPPLLLFKFGDTSLKSGDTFHEWGGADGTHLQLWALLRSHEASNKIRLHAQFHLIWMAPQHITKMAIKWNLTDVIAQKARGDGIELGLFKPDLHSEIKNIQILCCILQLQAAASATVTKTLPCF